MSGRGRLIDKEEGNKEKKTGTERERGGGLEVKQFYGDDKKEEKLSGE